MITVLVPGIRPNNWKKLYKSCVKAIGERFEIIFISPYKVPGEIKDYPGIKHIQDLGTPIKCQQRGLLEANGQYITWAADDGIYMPESLSKALSLIEDYKTVVVGKYTESEHPSPMMWTDEYYILSNHDSSAFKYVPKDYMMLNAGLISRDLLIEIGGWDCQFEVCPMAYNDLAIRLQNYGAKFVIPQEIMFKCSHLPGMLGDHGPVHLAQTLHDEPLFKEIYSNVECNKRTVINPENWRNCDAIWERRFDINNLPK